MPNFGMSVGIGIGAHMGCGPFAAFSPLSLAPLLWLDGSDASTLFDATAGGSLVAANGAIARWEDKSGNGRHATNATAGMRPLRKVAVRNGRDAVLFDNSDDGLLTAYSLARPHTFFLVSSQITGGGSTRLLTSSDQNRVVSPNRTAGNSVYNGTTNYAAAWAGANEWVITTFSQTSAPLARLFKNGTALTLVSPAVTNDWGLVQLGSGGTFPEPGDGHVAELLVFPSELSVPNQQAVESYLASKWGITIP